MMVMKLNQIPLSFKKTDGTSYTWSLTASMTIGMSIEVSAGIPEIAQVKESFSWTIGISSTYSRTVDTTKTIDLKFPVIVGARTRTYGTFKWWDSVCDVPYTASLIYTFFDHSNYTISIKDVYTGEYITNVESDYHDVPLKPGEMCPQNNNENVKWKIHF